MRFYISILFFFTVSLSVAQTYNLSQLEASFLENNYLLLAARFDVSKAEAAVVQEKVWANPSVAISEVNLWANSGSERLSPLVGKYGERQQISIELEQLVETAGKRQKRTAIKRLEYRVAVYEFEELIRELRKELRQAFYHLTYLTYNRTELADMTELFERMQAQYQRQSQQENVSKADFHRVNNELVGMQKEMLLLETETASVVANLRILTGITDLEEEMIAVDTLLVQRPVVLPQDMESLLSEENIALKKQSAASRMAQEQLSLEKAKRVPDLTFQLGYDRGGNIMQDFVGLGVQIDLPVFNRNKGNITKAKQQIDQEQIKSAALQQTLEQTVQRYKKQFLNQGKMLRQWAADEGEEQRTLIDNYRKHMEKREVTLVEFLDYVESHRAARQAFLELWQSYHDTLEELQYLLGKDF